MTQRPQVYTDLFKLPNYNTKKKWGKNKFFIKNLLQLLVEIKKRVKKRKKKY